MNDLNWLDFLDRIAREKELTPKQKITLKAKYPVFNGRITNNQSLIDELELQDENSLKKRLGTLFKAFDVLDKIDNDKAIELQGYLNERYKQEQEVLVQSTELPTSDELWSRLKGLGHHTRSRMGISVKPMTLPTMGGAFQEEDSSSEFLDTVAKDTQRLQFKIYKGKGKVVLLLNRDEKGHIWCVCPSVLTPSIEFDREEMTIPQPKESEDRYLPKPKTAGKEDWWAWIVSEEARQLSWLEAAQNPKGYKLSPQDLSGLLQHVMNNPSGEVLHTYYLVVENNR